MLVKKLNQVGETIIEVLIALSVFGLTLGLSYATASRSLRASRDAQERTEAYQYAQSIIETIKEYSENGYSSATYPVIFPVSGNGDFCVDTSTINTNPTSGPVRANPVSPNDPTSPVCQNELYTQKVTVSDATTGTPAYKIWQYKVLIEWEALSGHGKNTVEMIYRLAQL